MEHFPNVLHLFDVSIWWGTHRKHLERNGQLEASYWCEGHVMRDRGDRGVAIQFW